MERAELEQWRAKEVARLLALVETERRYYQEMVAAVPIGLLILSSERVILFANRAFRRLSGMRSEDLGRKTLEQILPIASLGETIAEIVSSGVARKNLVFSHGGRNLRVSGVPIRNWVEENDVEALVTVEDFTGLEAPPDRGPQEAISQAPAVLWIADSQSGRFRIVSSGAETLLGYPVARWLEAGDYFPQRIHPGDRERVRTTYRSAGDDASEHTTEYRSITADGRVIWCRETIRRIGDSHDLAGVLTGAGERRFIEERCVQEQRMNALGNMAARLAHDLNNPLMIVTGYGEELLGNLPAASPLRADMEEILAAGERIGRVTNHLLAATRRQGQAVKPVNLSPLVSDLSGGLPGAAGDRGEALAHTTEPFWVMANPGQLAGLLAALVATACQRAREEQRVQFGVRAHDIREDIPDRGVPPGYYGEIILSDPGWVEGDHGRLEMFEGFLPAKDPEDTGVELWRSYAVARDWGGYLWHTEEPAAFHLLLPRAEPPAEVAPEGERKSEAPASVAEPRMETVLVVEDEGGIRALVRKILKRQGYEVLEASSAEEAIQLAAGHTGPIHLLLTDVLLPRMNGPELAGRLRSTFSGLRVLYVSGYADDAALVEGNLPPLSGFLQKPFTLGSLLGKVREVLDKKSEA